MKNKKKLIEKRIEEGMYCAKNITCDNPSQFLKFYMPDQDRLISHL